MAAFHLQWLLLFLGIAVVPAFLRVLSRDIFERPVLGFTSLFVITNMFYVLLTRRVGTGASCMFFQKYITTTASNHHEDANSTDTPSLNNKDSYLILSSLVSLRLFHIDKLAEEQFSVRSAINPWRISGMHLSKNL